METQTNHIVIIIIASVCMIALMLFVIVDLFLVHKNRQLKFQNELLALNSKFEKEILEVQNEVTEQVFNDIASELHDNVCQTLTLAVSQINHYEADNEIPNHHVSASRETIRQALTDLRNLSHSLSGDYWMNFDIYSSLNRLGDKITTLGKIRYNINIDPDLSFDSKDHEIIVIRVLQELINNSLKHSSATLIDLTINQEEAGVHIVYTDDGIGYNNSKVSEGMGLISIHQRLTLLKANWNFNSENHKGFRFESTIPVTHSLKINL